VAVDRVDPPLQSAEKPMLVAWLDYQRATLARKCDGLDARALRRMAVPPSTLSLLGLVRHMSEVERGWFRRSIAGEDAPPMYYSKSNPDGDFDDVDTADVEEAFATWRSECEHSRAITQAHALDDVGCDDRKVSLRWLLVHMIEEYARHNGHADLLRQVVDGDVMKQRVAAVA
jgi:uncharacterized damage-inducible protein DinB